MPPSPANASSDSLTSVARVLGHFAATTASEALPAIAVERAKMIVVSTLASASRGFDIGSTQAMRRAERALCATSGPSAIWFGGETLPADRAARVNAVASDSAASDDSDLRSIAHIGTVATAAGLAVAQAEGSGGLDLLAAIVLGYEVAGRIDEVLTPGRMQRGFHGSVSTIFAATVSAGRLLSLGAEPMAHALSLAASSACGLAISADTSFAREYHAGLAAMLGVQAAYAAQAGFESELTAFESNRGFFDAFNGQSVESVTAGLGDDWDIVTDMAIKLMPGAHPFHAIAQAAIDLSAVHDLRPAQVARAMITAPQLKVWAHQAVPPHDLISAAHSVPYFVACAIADRHIGWNLFSPEKMFDPVVVELIGRITFDPDPPPHPDRFGHRHGGTVTVWTNDGRELRHTCQAPRGSGATGIEWADIDAKFHHLAPREQLSANDAERLLHILKSLDSRLSLGEVWGLLGPANP